MKKAFFLIILVGCIICLFIYNQEPITVPSTVGKAGPKHPTIADIERQLKQNKAEQKAAADGIKAAKNKISFNQGALSRKPKAKLAIQMYSEGLEDGKKALEEAQVTLEALQSVEVILNYELAKAIIKHAPYDSRYTKATVIIAKYKTKRAYKVMKFYLFGYDKN